MILVNKKNKRYVNKNVIAKVSHNKYKDVLQSKKSFGGFGKKKGGGGGGGGGVGGGGFWGGFIPQCKL